MKKENLIGKKILIDPVVNTTDIGNNENLLTSVIYRMTKMLESLGAESVTMNDQEDFDVVVVRFINEDKKEKYIQYNKPVLEIYYDGLNDGWWFSSLLLNGKIYDNERPGTSIPNEFYDLGVDIHWAMRTDVSLIQTKR